MIKVTQEKWDRIPKDYKGKWSPGFGFGIPEELIGKRNVFAGSIVKGGGTALLTEGIDFEIVKGEILPTD